jgi:uncharacterized protein (DUF924 family)
VDDAFNVREFWFGKDWTGPLPSLSKGDSKAASLGQRATLWFGSDPQRMQERDELIKSRFQELVERAAQGELASWADSPRRRLSLIILLDQFPRQIYRGTARAFAHDEQALALTLSGMQLAADGALNVVERIFFYMPLEHAESLEVQDESLIAYNRLLVEAPAQLRGTFEEAQQAAEAHREVIRQFGRFPHRNRILGRSNTAAESTYLKEHPQGFGQ